MSLDILRVVEFSDDEISDIESLSNRLGMTVSQYVVAAVHKRSAEIISSRDNG